MLNKKSLSNSSFISYPVPTHSHLCPGFFFPPSPAIYLTSHHLHLCLSLCAHINAYRHTLTLMQKCIRATIQTDIQTQLHTCLQTHIQTDTQTDVERRCCVSLCFCPEEEVETTQIKRESDGDKKEETIWVKKKRCSTFSETETDRDRYTLYFSVMLPRCVCRCRFGDQSICRCRCM